MIIKYCVKVHSLKGCDGGELHSTKFAVFLLKKSHIKEKAPVYHGGSPRAFISTLLPYMVKSHKFLFKIYRIFQKCT